MVATLVAALVGTTTIGFAAATTAGVIYACVNNSSGTIHIASETAACSGNEVRLSWNAAGPQGPTGATGATGPSGPSLTFTVRLGEMLGGPGSGTAARAFCEPDEQVTGGGGYATNPGSVGLTQNGPIDAGGGQGVLLNSARGWQVASEGWGDVQVYVVCAR